MKLFITYFIFFCSFSAIIAQSSNPNYDQELATKLGADDYGMKKFVLVILKSGTNNSDNKILRDSCFQGHMTNIRKLVKDNKLIIAGPILKNEKSYRGIFILNVTSIEDAQKLLQSDPAIDNKYLEPDLFVWYGSAALSEYLDEADKIWKTKP